MAANHSGQMGKFSGGSSGRGLPSARQALNLRYEGSLRLAEIGRRLHRSEGAIKLLMFRARQALRDCLDNKLGRPSHRRGRAGHGGRGIRQGPEKTGGPV